jgi:hypothetical protein
MPDVFNSLCHVEKIPKRVIFKPIYDALSYRRGINTIPFSRFSTACHELVIEAL